MPDDLYTTDAVLEDVFNERERQLMKFGPDNPLAVGPDEVRLPCLGEEMGEVNRVLAERNLGEDHEETTDAHLYKELVQVAAVACAWAESMVRDGRVDRDPFVIG